jgi:hypothetical protein
MSDEQTTSELVEQLEETEPCYYESSPGVNVKTEDLIVRAIKRLEALQARVDSLEKALQDIADQRTIAEIVERHGYDKLDECDFEGAYEILVTIARAVIARAALKATKETS